MLKPSNLFTTRRGKAAELFSVCRGLEFKREDGSLQDSVVFLLSTSIQIHNWLIL